MTALYKGARAPKKKSLLQVFTPLWIQLDERRDWFFVRALEMKGPSLTYFGDNLFSALYLNELIFHALPRNEADEFLFVQYEIILQQLVGADRRQLEMSLRTFELALLKACGYELSLATDINDSQILAERYYQFSVGHGFLLAEKGILGQHLLAIEAHQLDDEIVLKSAKIILRQAIDHALGGKILQTRQLYQKSKV